MLRITSKGPSRTSTSSFEVIENAASGDCLYLSVLDFMQRHKSSFIDIPADVSDLRLKVVEYTFSKNAIGFRSNWDRFADNILYNLHTQLPILLNNDAPEEGKKDAYKVYTCTPGNEGTSTELTLMAEIFGFDCFVVRMIDNLRFNCYELSTSDGESRNAAKPKFFVYFTGSLTTGHFRYLHPVKGKKPIVIEPGQYVIAHETVEVTPNLISITNRIEKAAATSSVTTSGLIPCPHCPIAHRKSFRGQRGLKVHISRRHPDLVLLPDNPQTDSSPLGDQMAKLKARTRLLIRIPKSARKTVADQLSKTIDDVVKRNDKDSWSDLLLFAYKALRVPERTSSSLVVAVKRNSNTLELPKLPAQDPKPLPLEKRVEAKLADNDVRGAVKIISSEDTLAPFDDSTYQELRKKHPAPSRELNIPDAKKAEDYHLVVSPKDVKHGISSFSHGSAPGLDGFRPQHIKDLTSFSAGDAGPRLLASITNLCNLMLSGKVDSGICSILYGAALCALNKKSGGIRPIAIGNYFRRLTAKIGCFSQRNASAKRLGPHQMGVGIQKGAEAVVHATRTWLNSSANRNKVLVKIDYVNAFNSAERDSMLTEVEKHSPLLFPFLHQCYSSPSILYFGDKNLESQVGAQQGDPAGSLAFSLAIQPIVEEISTDLNVWYLDDGTIGDFEDIVYQNFKVITERSKALGLKINPSKCELFFCSGIVDDLVVDKFNEISPGIQVVNRSNLTLLGSPIFDECFETAASEKLSSLRSMTNRLKGINSHAAYFLLKNCFAIPKLTYFLRTCPTWRFPEFLSNFDSAIRGSLENILNIQLEGKQWIQATLPISFGGIGVRRAQDINLPAFLASAFGARSLVANILNSNKGGDFSIHLMDEALSNWQASNATDLPLNPELQRNWDHLNVKRIIHSDLQFNSEKDIARFNALQAPESGKWLNALPVPNNGTQIDNNTIRICIGLRLGAKICHSHTCRCGVEVSDDGVHGLSCPKNLTKYSRHSEINNILQRALSSINVPSTLEPPGLSRSDGKRPDGLTLIPWESGKPLIWDATVLDTLANSYVSKTSTHIGAAAELGSQIKHRHYTELKASNYIFVPVALESFGPWAKEAKLFIDIIGSRLNKLTGSRTSRHYLHQRISLAIQRYNASCVMETVPTSSPLDEIFYILSKRPLID